jgi:hypothetical protein
MLHINYLRCSTKTTLHRGQQRTASGAPNPLSDFAHKRGVGPSLIPPYRINRISGCYSEFKSFKKRSLSCSASTLASKPNRITSLRKNTGWGSGHLPTSFSAPRSRPAKKTMQLADNRQIIERIHDAMLSSNFHLPILSAVLTSIPV